MTVDLSYYLDLIEIVRRPPADDRIWIDVDDLAEIIAIAAAARQGGDVQQAPGEAPQSGGDSRIAHPKGAA